MKQLEIGNLNLFSTNYELALLIGEIQPHNYLLNSLATVSIYIIGIYPITFLVANHER